MTINEWSDATAMAQAVQNKTVSPRELVEATIREAERTNPNINAIVSQRYQKALEEAETRDFSEKPFAGVPIFLKDPVKAARFAAEQQRLYTIHGKENILDDPYYNPNLTRDREDFSESDDLRRLKEGRVTVRFRGGTLQ